MDPAQLSLQQALSEGLDDEFRARATYQSVLDTYGPVWPFVNIRQSEQRHIDALLPLFKRYGIPVPIDRWVGQVEPPPSIAKACHDGVVGEIGNYQMYDRLLLQVTQPDVRQVFSNLRNAAAYHHLPAFQRCTDSATNSFAGFWLPLAAGAVLGMALGMWWRNAR